MDGPTIRPAGAAGAALAAILTLAAPAAGQDIQAFKPTVGTWNYLSVDGADVAAPGALVPSVWLSYAREPLVLRDDDGEVLERVIDDLTTVEILLAIGLHDRFELGVALPFGYATGSGTVPIDTGAGLGDIRLDPKLRIFEAGAAVRVALALHAPLVFPTGDEDKGASGRFFTASPGAIVELTAGRVRAAIEGGYRWRPADEDASALTVGNGIQYAAAAAVALGADRDLEAMVEIYGTVYEDNGPGQGGPQPLELLGGVRVAAPLGLTATLGAGTGLIPDFGAPEFRVVSGLAWQPASDPRGPTVVQVAGGPGLSDGDADGDGVKDSADACPAVAEDRDGFDDVDGCPDSDNDRDGIADADDACPNFPEDLDGRADDDGCPDTDDDGDGIADGRDACPGLPETHNGIADTDGCPDSADVTLRPDRMDVSAIYFDTGSARIKARSYPVLDQVAEMIGRDAGIKRLRVVGHTDAHGTAQVNQWLSRARAKRVRRYLERQGVPRGLIEVVGKGESEVFGTGLGQLDGARSRRVEFLIVERDAPVIGELDGGPAPAVAEPAPGGGWAPAEMPETIPPDPTLADDGEPRDPPAPAPAPAPSPAPSAEAPVMAESAPPAGFLPPADETPADTPEAAPPEAAPPE